MTMFGKHMSAVQAHRAEMPAVVVPPVGDDVPAVADPLDGAPGDDDTGTDVVFDEQRARRIAQNREDGVTQEVDLPKGDDDKLTIPASETDVKLPTGDFGEEPTKTETDGDTTVDADSSEVHFTSEEDDAENMKYDMEFDQIEQDADMIDSMNSEMEMLSQSMMAIESYGLNPSTVAIMQTTRLLSGTALESMALESVSFSKPEDAESLMAIEALGEKLKEKEASWSAKILHVVKVSGEKLISVLDTMWTGISGMVKKLGSAAWDKTKAAGAAVKAHPYVTIASVVASIAAVAAVVAFAGAGAPAAGAKVEAIASFLKKIAADINKIKFPGGKIMAVVNEAGTKISVNFVKVKDVVGAAAGSWSANAVNAVSQSLGRAWGAIKTAWTALGDRGMKLVSSLSSSVKDVKAGFGHAYDVHGAAGAAATKFLKKTVGDGRAEGLGAYLGTWAYFASVAAVFSAMFRLTRWVVVGGFRMIAATFRVLLGHTQPATA